MKNFQKDILNFWFVETSPQQWFQKSDDFDHAIIERFSEAYELAVKGKFDEWKNSVDGTLALIILLDQMPRNMYRNTPKAFATDAKALDIAKEAVTRGYDQKLTPEKRRFLYLPYEHSENMQDQEQSVELFATMKERDPLGYDYAVRHYDVIKKYGRFPHRNDILERDNTPQEAEYLSQPNAGF